MIVGIGIDTVHLPDFRELLSDEASHFRAATFSADEIAYAQQGATGDPAVHLAVRYAAKEATIKALDVALAAAGRRVPAVQPADIVVERDPAGRPSLKLLGAVAELAYELGVQRQWVSLSHDGPTATAVVVLEGS